MPSQTLITGATGFIGRQLTRDLLAKGQSVRVLARNPAKAQELFGDDVEVTTGDLSDPASLEQACRGVSVIYHIAGIYRFGLRHRQALWAANVDGADNLFASAARARVDKVVHLSSAGILGRADTSDVTPLNETHFPTYAPRFSAYKSSKWHSEHRALEWAKKGLAISIAGTTCPIGRGDDTPTPTGRIIHDFLQRRFPFYCHTALNFVDIGDLSQGLQLVAESGRTGERYLLCNENLWLKDFLGLLAQVTGLPAPTRCLPNGLIRLIGCGGEVVDFLNPSETGARVCVETALQAGRVQFFSNAKARRELGWNPATPLCESIVDAVAWYRDGVEVDLPRTAAASVGSHVG